MRYLTKSRFKIALECPTKLYYSGKKEYANAMATDDFLQALAEGGYQVGELAKFYHPGGILIDEIGHRAAQDRTEELLLEEQVILYEPAFLHGDCFIRVDVLVKDGNRFDLIEVKAKSFRAEDEFYNKKGGIASSWKPYLWDVAFQTWVMQQIYPSCEINSYLMLADKKKVSTVDNLNQKFKIRKNERGRTEVVTDPGLSIDDLGEHILTKVDVSAAVDLILSDQDIPSKNARNDQLLSFNEKVNQFAQYYKQDDRYPVGIGKHCKSCEYSNKHEPAKLSGFDECWQNELGGSYDLDKPHVFEVWNYRKSDKLIESGIYTITDLYSDADHFRDLNERQQLQVSKSAEKEETEWISDQLSVVVAEWKYPLHFIDFETSMVAVPFYKGFRPYEQIAFQFSHHTVYEDGKMKHEEWICAEPGVFPNFEFVKALKLQLEKDDGTIFRYAHHENTVLRQVQKQMEDLDPERYEEWIEWIDTITQWKDEDNNQHISGRNMVDMWSVLKKHYYHPLMLGSNSIKAVLPAIFQTSRVIRDKYSNPLDFGLNLTGMNLWQKNSETGVVQDPYKLLPDKFQELDLSLEELVLEDGQISDGAAAAVAFAKMQFTEMSENERRALKEALRQYCELDTLAMVMIWEHWKDVVNG
jgi:hypothetical protein